MTRPMSEGNRDEASPALSGRLDVDLTMGRNDDCQPYGAKDVGNRRRNIPKWNSVESGTAEADEAAH
ncbi:hypothetical protein R1flu_000993 [Riccia fluitans]|uniref:Uncharacterized protein n=1 Tax=Riccia fluitans TaxID=41844 RepID=A0ABD1Y1Z7_9MARC